MYEITPFELYDALDRTRAIEEPVRAVFVTAESEYNETIVLPEQVAWDGIVAALRTNTPTFYATDKMRHVSVARKAPDSSKTRQYLLRPLVARWQFTKAELYGNDVLQYSTTIEMARDLSYLPFEEEQEHRRAINVLATPADTYGSRVAVLGIGPTKTGRIGRQRRVLDVTEVADAVLNNMIPPTEIWADVTVNYTLGDTTIPHALACQRGYAGQELQEYLAPDKRPDMRPVSYEEFYERRRYTSLADDKFSPESAHDFIARKKAIHEPIYAQCRQNYLQDLLKLADLVTVR